MSKMKASNKVTNGMNPKIKRKWLTALRSGKYKQIKGQLKKKRKDGAMGHCCLGVLCEIAVKERVISGFDSCDAFLPNKVEYWAGLACFDPSFSHPVVTKSGRTMRSLTALNDDAGYSFAKIADIIEEQL